MPRYNPNEEDLDSSYGAQSAVKPPPDSGGDTPPEAKGPQESVDEQAADGAEILIAKDKLPDAKEGDECTFRVVRDYGDEFSLEFVKPEAEAEEETSTDNLSTPEQDFAAMDAKGV
jgi:hypothetical protein